jgi:hypothetical protein
MTTTTTTTEKSIRIEGIYTCANASKEMISKSTATLIAGVGLEGDRYANKIGTYSVLPEPGRQLTMISADGVDAAWLEQEHLQPNHPRASAGNLRRNIVLRGISADDLRNAIGSVIQFESHQNDDESMVPQVFVHRNCVPW